MGYLMHEKSPSILKNTGWLTGTKRGLSVSDEDAKNDVPLHKSGTNNESQSDVSTVSSSSSGDSALSKISRKKKILARKSLRRAKRKEKAHVKNLEKNKISMEDFLSKQTELKIWLAEEKNKDMKELSSPKLKVYFKTFMKMWNKKKLPERYYRGLVTTGEAVKVEKPSNQRFTFTTDVDVEEMYKIHVPDLFSIPQEDILSLDSPFTTFGKQPSVRSFGLSSTDSEYCSAYSKVPSADENEPLDGKRKRVTIAHDPSLEQAHGAHSNEGLYAMVGKKKWKKSQDLNIMHADLGDLLGKGLPDIKDQGHQSPELQSHVYDVPYVSSNTSSEDDKQTTTTPVMKFGNLLRIRNKKSITPYKVTTLQWSKDGKLVFGSSDCKNKCKKVDLSSENDTSFSISASSETSASSVEPNNSDLSQHKSDIFKDAEEKLHSEQSVDKSQPNMNGSDSTGNPSTKTQPVVRSQDSNVSMYECMDQSVCRPQNSTQLTADANMQSVYECMDQSSIHPDLNQSTFRDVLDQSILRKEQMRESELVVLRKNPVGHSIPLRIETISQPHASNEIDGKPSSEYIAIDQNASKRLSVSMMQHENEYYELEKTDKCFTEEIKMTQAEKTDEKSFRPQSYLYAVPLKRKARENTADEKIQESVNHQSNKSDFSLESSRNITNGASVNSMPSIQLDEKERGKLDGVEKVCPVGEAAIKVSCEDEIKVQRNTSSGSDVPRPVLGTNYNRNHFYKPKQEDLELIDIPQFNDQYPSDKENDGSCQSKGRTPKKQIKMGIGHHPTGSMLQTKPQSFVPPDLKSSRKKFQITSV